ncbi:HAD family hydrolase [Bowmanella sp. JS7-9]|uniref:HAD family hydrolase n=1 Tax=Pseudobowmanella zhangzhouensis TaxID=1537679 RepID=A0ABW1XIZ8_9ALTE|nr:HAD-IA family hydrolase [Bowmanella sp. JS7-9]TBX27504.1 HAD family hydrolase [Bowmanella sp. JS7-9]
MKFKAVIFDWDGTLMDSTPRIVSCVQNAARRAGLPVPQDEAVNNIIGLSLRPALGRLFQSDDPARVEQLVDLYRDEYLYRNPTPSPLFSAALPLLTALKKQGRLLAVATGKARPGLDRVMQETQTGHYFHITRCADEARSKPHPQMLEQIIEHLQIRVDEAVMIGDTEHDMGMAAAIGMPRIGVTYGAQPAHKLEPHKPLAIIDDLQDLMAVL